MQLYTSLLSHDLAAANSFRESVLSYRFRQPYLVLINALPYQSDSTRVPHSSNLSHCPCPLPGVFPVFSTVYRPHTWAKKSSTIRKSPPKNLGLPLKAMQLEPRHARQYSERFIGMSVCVQVFLLKGSLIIDRCDNRLEGLSRVSSYPLIRHHPKRASTMPIIFRR